MKYIKLFENFDKDYVKDSIKDLLIELQDMGMLVEVWYWKPKKKWKMGKDHNEYFSISIPLKKLEKKVRLLGLVKFLNF